MHKYIKGKFKNTEQQVTYRGCEDVEIEAVLMHTIPDAIWGPNVLKVLWAGTLVVQCLPCAVPVWDMSWRL